MTIETYRHATRLIEQIEGINNQIAVLSAPKMMERVKTRVQGMDFELPKAAFRSEVNKKKAGLESQLTTLQNEFDAL